MTGAIKPAYLIVPAYCIGVPLICFCGSVLAVNIGVPVAALLGLILLSGPSLLHGKIPCYDFEGFIVINFALYACCLGLAVAFAGVFIPTSFFGGSFTFAGAHLGWLQVFFVALQQACYFGVHAFAKGD